MYWVIPGGRRSTTLCSKSRSRRMAAAEQSSRAAAGLINGWPASISPRNAAHAAAPTGRKTPAQRKRLVRAAGLFSPILRSCIPRSTANARIFLHEFAHNPRVAPCSDSLNCQAVRTSGKSSQALANFLIADVCRPFGHRVRGHIRLRYSVTFTLNGTLSLVQTTPLRGKSLSSCAASTPGMALLLLRQVSFCGVVQQTPDDVIANLGKFSGLLGNAAVAIPWLKNQEHRIFAWRGMAEHHQIPIAGEKAKNTPQGPSITFRIFASSGAASNPLVAAKSATRAAITSAVVRGPCPPGWKNVRQQEDAGWAVSAYPDYLEFA